MADEDEIRALIDWLRRELGAGRSKADCVRAGASRAPWLTRALALLVYGEALGMSAAQASTYYYGYHVRSRGETDVQAPTGIEPVPEEVSTQTLRELLVQTSETAAQWYLERTTPIDRERFKGKIKDDGRGAVYSYHDSESTLYVGITGYRVKSRLTTPTSPHNRKPWWPLWEQMRFLPLTNRSERETLEHLLILGLDSVWNKKPGSMDLDSFLDRL